MSLPSLIRLMLPALFCSSSSGARSTPAVWLTASAAVMLLNVTRRVAVRLAFRMIWVAPSTIKSRSATRPPMALLKVAVSAPASLRSCCPAVVPSIVPSRIRPPVPSMRPPLPASVIAPPQVLSASPSPAALRSVPPFSSSSSSSMFRPPPMSWSMPPRLTTVPRPPAPPSARLLVMARIPALIVVRPV